VVLGVPRTMYYLGNPTSAQRPRILGEAASLISNPYLSAAHGQDRAVRPEEGLPLMIVAADSSIVAAVARSQQAAQCRCRR
jgi:hypothetical protein